jgi:flagellar basal-body rod modification protein FlgD
MATPAIWNHGSITANQQMNTNPKSTTPGGSADSGGGASISANDFLSLLVTEMKNQDPTATTDPNEYINQLVQVNSLEQLISINQNLSTALGISAAGSGQVAGNSQERVNNNANAAAERPMTIGYAAQPVSNTARGGGVPADAIPGNLSVPRTSPAAVRVGHALGRP